MNYDSEARNGKHPTDCRACTTELLHDRADNNDQTNEQKNKKNPNPLTFDVFDPFILFAKCFFHLHV